MKLLTHITILYQYIHTSIFIFKFERINKFTKKKCTNVCLAACTDLGEVKLQRVVCGQRDHEASGQVLRQRVAVVAEEQAVIAERGHGDAYLSQVIQILQHRSLEVQKV